MPEPCVIPAPLERGARVRIIAPSSPFDRALVLAGAAWLGERYRVEFDWSMFERSGFLAGNDERRLTELDRALRDPSLAAIIAARGGYGLTRIAHLADYAALARHPKWLIGFSDITALHVEALNVGVVSLHGPNAAGLGRGDAWTRARFIQAVEAPDAPLHFDQLGCIRRGRAEGMLSGGNLSLLFTCQATGRLRLPRGTLLAIEDVTESSYRVDRMLSALLASGALDVVSGVILGDFTDCPDGPHRVPVRTVLEERLGQLGVPVASGLRFGHERWNEFIPLGRRARLDAGAGTLTIEAEA